LRANRGGACEFRTREDPEAAVAELSSKERDELPKREFAFPEQRKAPIEDAGHVRSAIARFNQVKDVSDAERDAAWKRILAAAKKFDVDVQEKDWREIGR